jgi:hypothetical protein
LLDEVHRNIERIAAQVVGLGRTAMSALPAIDAALRRVVSPA